MKGDGNMTREECLDEAKKCVCTDRNRQYGSPEDNFALIAKLWQDYLHEVLHGVAGIDDAEILPEDVANMMILLKIARNATGLRAKADSWIDICGYSACGCEIATGGKR